MASQFTSTPARIAILGFDGCMTSAVTGLLDTFQIANAWAMHQQKTASAPFTTQVLAADRDAVLGSGHFAIPAVPLSRAGKPTTAIVPPIMGPARETVAANPALVAWLREAHDITIASVCAGAFFLAEAGLLRGKRATTNPAFAQAFRESYRDVTLLPEERLIDEGRILCAGSTTAFFDLAIYLIERHAGHEVAVLTAKSLCVDKNRRSQLPYFVYIAPKDHGDDAVFALQTWLEENHRTQISVAALARRSAMSQRSLNRRFRDATRLTPLEYLHRVRIESAKRLLESSSLSVEQITLEVGYEDARSFSRLFASLSGMSPRDYRARFGPRLELRESTLP